MKIKKMLKRILITLSITVFLVIAALVLVPVLFKDEILTEVKKVINKNINATVEFSDFNLSLISNFPNLTIELEGFIVAGIDAFEKDTLLTLDLLSTTVDVESVLKGGQIEIKEITLVQPNIYAKVLKDGKANWDIAKEDTTTTDISPTVEEPTENTDTASGFKIGLEIFEIINANIVYDDQSSNMYADIKNLNLKVKGDFTASETNLLIENDIESLSFLMDDIKYLNNIAVNMDADISADLDNMLFTFRENTLKLNALLLGFDGTFAMLNSGYDMDITFDAKQTNFKTLLSFIPAIYQSDFDELKTSGKLALNGYAKGVYQEEIYPAFGIELNVINAKIQYPDLPESIDNINIDLKIQNKGSDLDNTIINLSKFSLLFASNLFTANLLVKNPMSDPNIKGMIDGDINLTSLKKTIPLEDSQLKGDININVSMNGRMSYIENEQYEKFNVTGHTILKDFVFTSTDFPEGVTIKNAHLLFSPQFLELKQFDAYLGKSDFKLYGKIQNYIPYALDDGTLVGNLVLNSDNIDVNEFLDEEAAPETAMEETKEKETSEIEVEETTAVPSDPIEIPRNLNITFQSKIKNIIYDKLIITNTDGAIKLKNGIASITNFKMNLLQGSMSATGNFSTQNPLKPKMDFDFVVTNIDLSDAYTSFSIIKEMVPIAIKTEGKVSTTLKYQSFLDTELMPIMSTVNGKGNLTSKGVVIKDSDALNKLATALKNDSYKQLKISNLNINYVLTNGNLEVKPFTTQIAGNKTTFKGTQSIEGNMDYRMKMDVKLNELNPEISEVLSKLPASVRPKTLPVGIKITGTTDNIKVTPDFSEAKNSVIGTAKDEVKKRLNEEKEKLEAEARKRINEEKKKLETELKRKAQEEVEKQKKLLQEKGKDLLDGLF